MATTDQITTAEQLLRATGLGRCELVGGRLITRPYLGVEAGCAAASVGALLGEFVERHRLGAVVAATGFQITHDPDTVLSPAVAFVRKERLPPPHSDAFFDGAADLAVEILSPGDRPSEVTAKVQDWLAAGCREVWVADPKAQTVLVHRGPGEALMLRAADVLTSDDLLPGFRLAVAEAFAL